MSRRLNVLLISNLFPTPVDSIRGVFTYQIVKRLSADCDVTVVCPLPWFPTYLKGGVFAKWAGFARIPRVYEWGGIRVHSPKYPMVPKVSESVHPWLMLPTLSRTVKRLHQQRPFDVINTQWLYPDGVAAARIADSLNVPHVLTALGCDANLFLTQPAKRGQIEVAIRKAQRVTVVSAALQEFIRQYDIGGTPIDVIPNGVDAEIFWPRDKSACAAELGISPRSKSILFVGQLLEVKGVIYLLEAIDSLIRSGEDVSAYLVGEGPGRLEYEAEVARRGLSGRVTLVGNRPHDEIAVWMGACDVFCLPSIREGFPNVVLEALFSGRPVVASRTGGIPEMVNGRNGLLVEPRNATALADALKSALDRTWDAVAILQSVSHLSWERAAQSYLQSLRAAIDSFPRGGN